MSMWLTGTFALFKDDDGDPRHSFNSVDWLKTKQNKFSWDKNFRFLILVDRFSFV